MRQELWIFRHSVQERISQLDGAAPKSCPREIPQPYGSKHILPIHQDLRWAIRSFLGSPDKKSRSRTYFGLFGTLGKKQILSGGRLGQPPEALLLEAASQVVVAWHRGDLRGRL